MLSFLFTLFRYYHEFCRHIQFFVWCVLARQDLSGSFINCEALHKTVCHSSHSDIMSYGTLDKITTTKDNSWLLDWPYTQWNGYMTNDHFTWTQCSAMVIKTKAVKMILFIIYYLCTFRGYCGPIWKQWWVWRICACIKWGANIW